MKLVANRLQQLKITLPALLQPVANYVPFVMNENVLYLAGHGPFRPDGMYEVGKVGANVTTEQAYAHAHLAGINLLASMQEALGDLDRVTRIVKVLGMVNATPDFTQHPEVINGFSDLMVQVFGDAGRHARSAVGVGSLPCGMTVEIEMIVSFRM